MKPLSVSSKVNSAGGSRPLPVDAPEEDWEEAMTLNFSRVRQLTHAILPGMMARKWGRVVNVLNIGAKAPRPNSMPTSISRAAGMAMTKALSHELAPHNVLVNAMLVGLIRADQHVQTANRANMTLEEYYKTHAKEIPIARFGEAEEFANLACFLVSEQGSYITGTAINVDGGRSPVV